jgi:hypothetical protein
VREVKLRLAGQDLGTVRQFYARPDVAAHYGRKNLLYSGWQVFVNLPPLRPGMYRLEVEATDNEGTSGKLDPLSVQVTE